MESKTSLFPFPHVIEGQARDGSMLHWPQTCIGCATRQCEKTRSQDLEVCAYGYNYRRVDPKLVVAGILVRDFPSTSAARKKRMQHENMSAFPSAWLDQALEAYQAFEGHIAEDLAAEKARKLREYQDSVQFKQEFLHSVRDDIQKGLAFFHDYKQINTQISHNINVLIETGYPGAGLPEKLTIAKPAERAIYEAAKFLEEKLNVAKFLMNPEWLQQRDECKAFRFHGQVVKYEKIYKSLMAAKKIKVVYTGDSRLDVFANPQAVAVIPHTLIDNAVKYSPQNAEIEISLHDRDGFIDFSVTSWGPYIKPSEEDQIFDPFFRGSAAKKLPEEGAGYGLFVSQMVAKEHLGSDITVEQHRSLPMADDRFRTSFSINIPVRAKIL